MTEFDAWAIYYDFVHQGLPGEVEFYTGLAAKERLDTLELGCGTGRIALPMAMSGVAVTGLDLSRNMLHLCREKLRALGPLSGNLYLLQADMRDFALGRRFPLIVMPYRTFMHLLTPAEQVRCLECVREHLSGEGRFVLNLWAARPTFIAAASTHADGALDFAGEYDAGDGIRLMHFHSVEYDEHAQRILERHHIEEHDPEGRVVDSTDLTLERAWLTPREMEHLANRCGFAPVDVLGSFDGAPFSASSTEMIWVLRRA